ncbi:LysR family transcriptional regulator [Labrys neptuniae]
MVSSERFQAIRAFLQAAEAESFSAAAVQLGLSKSTVGKAIARLEERLQVRLFQRTTRKLALTDAGRSFRDSCRQALDELARAEAALASHAHAPVGRLRIALPALFGRDRVMPILLNLLHRHERLEIEALFSSRHVDFIEDGVDLAVRIGELPDTISLTARRLGMQRVVTCASPLYLDRHGRPGHPDRLAEHQCIGILSDDHVLPWRFAERGKRLLLPVRGRLRVGQMQAALAAACAGTGLTQVPHWLAAEALAAGKLEIVLAAFEPPGLPVHVVWPSDAAMSARMRATIDALVEGLAEPSS